MGEVLQAFLDSEISPFPRQPAAKDANYEGDEVVATLDEIDPVQVLASLNASLSTKSLYTSKTNRYQDGLDKDSKSIICHRIRGDYCLFINEYETAVDTCRAGRKLLLEESRETGIALQKYFLCFLFASVHNSHMIYRNLDAIMATLATSLIHYQSPKYHDEAKTYFDAILGRNKSNITALFGVGLILEEQQYFREALEFFTKALEVHPQSLKISSEAAWCRVLMQDYEEGREGLERCLESITGVDAQARELKAQVLWRIGTCIWDADGLRPQLPLT